MDFYPCGVCQENCEGNDSVACDKCDRWFHQKCEKLTNSQLLTLSKTNLSFLCTQCCLTKENRYDFSQSLNRFSIAAAHGNLEQCAKIESILLRSHKLKTNKISSKINLPDENAKKLLGENKNFTPVRASANGNCLFNSISIALVRDESLSTELRVRTLIELVSYKKI